MAKIISFQWKFQDFDASKMPYKYAIPEHEPIKLSNGLWLHSYRVTKYNDFEPAGDPDIEQESFNNEMY